MISYSTLQSTTNSPQVDDDLAGDLLTTDLAIAQFLGKSRRQVQWMLQNGHLPVAFKIGKFWCVRKSSIRRYLEELERAAEAEAANATELAA